MLKIKKENSIELDDIKEKYQIPFWLKDYQILIPIKTKWKSGLIQLAAGLRILYYLSNMTEDVAQTSGSILSEYIVLYKSKNLKQVIRDIISIRPNSKYVSLQEVEGVVTIATISEDEVHKIEQLLNINQQIIKALDKDENILREYFKDHFNNFEMTE